jgi:shikimate dehydrogenase
VKSYGLIGASLKHSFSENYFTEKFRRENIEAVYSNFEIGNINELPSLIASHPHLTGLNVTIPYKQQIMAFIHELHSSAINAGAVNTIRIKRTEENITLEGFNTDCNAFADTIKPLLKKHHTKALILGTGGGAHAVRTALHGLSVQSVMVSRNKKEEGVISFNEITAYTMAECSVIVNCTPVGMYPDINSFPVIPYDFLTADHLAYDLIYNPQQTLFLHKAAAAGAVTKNGLEMLYKQAELAWKIWNE